MYTKRILQLGAVLCGVLFIGCSGSGGSTSPIGNVGGKQNVGGTSGTSTTSANDGTTGGATNQDNNTGGANTSAGGNAQTGGAATTAGGAATGGKSSTSATGGTKATGGTGTKATGGTGTKATGGTESIDTSAGGSDSTGGTEAGGNTSTEPQCVGNPEQLINPDGWNCDLNTDIELQGAVYPYGDGTSCAFGPDLPTSNICSDKGCCLSGTTTPATADTNYENWGCGIGMELNSSGGDSAVKSQYTGPVQCFDITMTGSSGKNEVRIGFTQASDTTGMVSPFISVAPFTDGYEGRVCFKDAECPDWEGVNCSKEVGTAGTPFDLQIQVSAGGTTAAVGAYDLCVTSIVPVIDPGNTGTTNSCTSATGTGTISDKGGTAHVTCSGKDYIVQNNVWGSGSATQTITYGPGTKFKVTNQTGNNSGDAPVSYPSLFIGANNGRSTSNSGLPLAVSSITTTGIKTAWTWAANGASGSYNAAYDVWFSTGSGGDPSTAVPSGGYLMVWYHKPTADQPIGELKTSAQIAGKNWNVWYGTNSGSGKPCVSYVAPTDVMSMEFNLGEFIKDAVTRGYVQNSWYLTNVYAGFEIWSGGVGLETKDFAVNVP